MRDDRDVVLRVWSARATRANAPQYLRHFTETVKPELMHLDGFLGSTVLQRDFSDSEVEFVVMTHWRTMDAVRAFAGDDIEAAVVERAAQAVLTDFDQRVRHYVVVDS